MECMLCAAACYPAELIQINAESDNSIGQHEILAKHAR